ncbi:MAG: hypothetical protein H0T73_21950 [Ardenticatenales bacterium]|nr:hypothetical protein [Ardenticatenales bacterium]
MDGDELIFHPQCPDALYVLPRHDTRIYYAGATFEQAVDWLCESGILSEPVDFMYFESWINRGKWRLEADITPFTYDRLREILLSLGLHQHVVDANDEEFLMLFVKQFYASIIAFITGNQRATIYIHYDLDKHSRELEELRDHLHSAGFKTIQEDES